MRIRIPQYVPRGGLMLSGVRWQRWQGVSGGGAASRAVCWFVCLFPYSPRRREYISISNIQYLISCTFTSKAQSESESESESESKCESKAQSETESEAQSKSRTAAPPAAALPSLPTGEGCGYIYPVGGEGEDYPGPALRHSRTAHAPYPTPARSCHTLANMAEGIYSWRGSRL